MKYFFLLLSAVFCYQPSHGQDTLRSTIHNVTVYLEGARVKRSVEVQLEKGQNMIVISGVSPSSIDKNSIRLEGLNNVKVNAISTNQKEIITQPNTPKVKKLQDKINALIKEKTDLEAQEKGFERELKLIDQNQKLNGSQSNLSIQKVKEFAAYYRERTNTISMQITDLENKKEDLIEKIRILTDRKSKLTTPLSKFEGFIDLNLKSTYNMKVTLNILYNLSDTGWVPFYDIMAESLQENIKLDFNAKVYQNTGEVWNNIDLELSTADPTTQNNVPDLEPWYLQFQPTFRAKTDITRALSGQVPGLTISEAEGIPGTAAKVRIRGTGSDEINNTPLYIVDGLPIHPRSFAELNPNNFESVQILRNEDATSLYGSRGNSGVILIQTKSMVEKMENVTSETYSLPEKYTISSNGKPININIDQMNLKTEYKYYSAPVMTEKVFLTAQLMDWEQYDLLPGEAKVYFEGSYAGMTSFNPNVVTDELTVSLGEDPKISIERKEVDATKSKSFFGGTRIVNKAYEITIKNNRNRNVQITLEDRIPQSRNEDIEVREIQYDEAQINEETGIIIWDLDLEPAEQISKRFSYQVRYPKDKRINLD